MQLTVTTYRELEQCVRSFKEGRFNVLMIVGAMGQSKSTIVRQFMPEQPKKVVWLKGGSISPFMFYVDLYKNKDATFVLDDCDQMYSDRTMIRLMKALCETDDTKKIGWHTYNLNLDKMDIPREFEVRSRVVIIANRWTTISQHVESMQDRGLCISFEPDVDEVLTRCGRWFDDAVVLEFVRQYKHLITDLSMRALKIASEMRSVGMRSWQQALRESLGIETLAILEEVLKDPRLLGSELLREKEFERRTAGPDGKGYGRSQYYWYKRKLERLRSASRPPKVARRRTKSA